MTSRWTSFAFAAGLILLACAPSRLRAGDDIQLGPRPFYLVEGMDEGPLKSRLGECADGPFHRTDISIGHRGAALQLPEHSKEAYEGEARMGAEIVECDVTFTSDGELVCRHSECDLHTTTSIVGIPALNEKTSTTSCTGSATPPRSDGRRSTSTASAPPRLRRSPG